MPSNGNIIRTYNCCWLIDYQSEDLSLTQDSCCIWCLFVDPVNVSGFPAGEFFVLQEINRRLIFTFHHAKFPSTHLEPQLNFLVCTLDWVRSMDDVAANLHAKITTNSSRCTVSWVGSAEHHTTGLDDIEALPHHWYDGSACHVLAKSWEECTRCQVAVMFLQELFLGLRKSSEVLRNCHIIKLRQPCNWIFILILIAQPGHWRG